MDGSIRRSIVQDLTANTMRGLLVGSLAVGYALSALALDALHTGLGLAGGESTRDTLGLLASAADYVIGVLMIITGASLFLGAVEAWRGKVLSFPMLILLGVPGYIVSLLPAALPEPAPRIWAIVASLAVVSTACIDQARALIGDNWLLRAMLRSFCLYAVAVVLLGLVMWLRIAPNAVRDLQRYGDLGGAASIVFDFTRTPVETPDGERGILLTTGGQSAVVLQPSCSTDPTEARLQRLSNTDLLSLPPGEMICPGVRLG